MVNTNSNHVSVVVLDRFAQFLVAVTLVLVPFHAFLTVWTSTIVGHFLLLRLWDELTLGLLALAVLYWLIHDPELRRRFVSNKLVRIIIVYAGVTLLLGCVAIIRHAVTPMALGYGLIINLRFLVWFLAVWIVAQRSDWLRRRWQALIFLPLVVVIIFGLLQFFVWPPNVLSHFGYGPNTYEPFITINQDSTIVRVQSTLRGANQLGAYLALILILLASLLAFARRQWKMWLLGAGAALLLVLTFSRSGWLGAGFGAAIVVVARLRHKLGRNGLVAITATAVLIGAIGFAVFNANPGAQDVVLHVSDHSTATQSSNEQHASALSSSVLTVLHEPLGRGTGTSGQASWYNGGHPIRNPESLLLQIGEETGWLGLGLFLAILTLLGKQLWQRRQDPLTLSLFASFLGLVVVSLFTYSWADDTLAFVWWGLAGIALARAASSREQVGHKSKSPGATAS